MACVEVYTRSRSSVTAESLSGTYTFLQDVSYMLALEEGQALINGESYAAGCYVGDAPQGQTLRFESARGVRFEAPAPADACP
jgi:hypothetical protein